jgi:hypothetical protein
MKLEKLLYKIFDLVDQVDLLCLQLKYGPIGKDREGY